MRSSWALFFVLFAALSAASPALAEQDGYLRAELGKKCFFDPRMSSTGTTSCATCHRHADGWGDGLAIAVGMRKTETGGTGIEGKRHTPGIVFAFHKKNGVFHDGRARNVTDQALMPLTNQNEMGNRSVQDVVDRMNRVGYAKLFNEIYGQGGCTAARLAEVLTAFEHTLVVDYDDIPIYRYLGGDKSALSVEEERGWVAFKKYECASCHKPEMDFRDDLYHNVGVTTFVNTGDNGRSDFTKDTRPVSQGGNAGQFSTPSLIGVNRRSFYFHHGDVKTLYGCVEFFRRGAVNDQGVTDPDKDKRVRPRPEMTHQEAKDIETFMTVSLDSHYWPRYERPWLPGDPLPTARRVAAGRQASTGKQAPTQAQNRSSR